MQKALNIQANEPQCEKTYLLTYAPNVDSDSASAQSDQSLYCPHNEKLHPWLFKMRLVQILIRLFEGTG